MTRLSRQRLFIGEYFRVSDVCIIRQLLSSQFLQHSSYFQRYFRYATTASEAPVSFAIKRTARITATRTGVYPSRHSFLPASDLNTKQSRLVNPLPSLSCYARHGLHPIGRSGQDRQACHWHPRSSSPTGKPAMASGGSRRPP